MELSQRARFEQLVLPHLNAAYTRARYLMRNDADAQDATQEAVLRALRHFGGFRGGDARAWLLTIVRNTCYNWHRKRSSDALAVEFDEELHSETLEVEPADAALIRSADGDTVHRALADLPAEFREVIVLRELEGHSYQEIAELVAIPMGTVMSRLARARKRLVRALGTPRVERGER